jgi:multisubunit Na+/H+ antiporter MnhB subunit
MIVVIGGVAAVVAAQFYLEPLALTDLTWHWIQHGIIGGGGLAVGAGAARLYQVGQPQARLYPSARGSVIVLVVGMGLAVFSQLYVDSLTNLSLTWHWLQHGLVFFGGVAVGEGAYGLYLRDQLRA